MADISHNSAEQKIIINTDQAVQSIAKLLGKISDVEDVFENLDKKDKLSLRVNVDEAQINKLVSSVDNFKNAITGAGEAAKGLKIDLDATFKDVNKNGTAASRGLVKILEQFGAESDRIEKKIKSGTKASSSYFTAMREGTTKLVNNLRAVTEEAEKNKKTSTYGIRTIGEVSQKSSTAMERLVKTYASAAESIKKVFKELEKAIRNFHDREKRAGRSGTNYFDSFFGTTAEQKETANQVISEAKKVTRQMKKVVGKQLSESLATQLKKAVSAGVQEGIQEGVKAGSSSINKVSDKVQFLNEMLDAINLTPGQKRIIAERFGQTITGRMDPATASAIRADKYVRQYKAEQEAAAKVEIARINSEKDIKRLEWLKQHDPVQYEKEMNTLLEKQRAEIETINYQRERMIKRDQETATNRKRYEEDAVKFREEAQKYSDHELTDLEKAEQRYDVILEKRKRIAIEAERNKYQSDILKSTEYELVKRARERTKEYIKANSPVTKLVKRMDALVKRSNAWSKVLSNAYQITNSLTNAFGKVRGSLQSLVTRFTNPIRSAVSSIRQLITSTISEGVDQYKQIESAKIGFKAFFSEKGYDPDDLIDRIKSEALKAPLVTAGDLSDYVRQLAPVSGGNADLAINAALGVLKTLQYSGSDSSEMEYVIKNIRDVITKGTATAIDKRQFNRALPGLENALKKSGLSNFVDSEGNLLVTKDNVGQILDMFAHLNTDEDSPVKDIFNEMLNTLEGVQGILKERLVTTTENVFTKSGLGSYITQQLLGVSNGDIFTKVEEFFTKHLRGFVNWLQSPDGLKIIETLKEEITGLYEHIKGIITGGKELLGTDGAVELIKEVFGVLKNVITGFADGVKQAIDIYKSVKNMIEGTLGKDGISTIGKTIGYILSPMGQILNSAGTIFTKLFRIGDYVAKGTNALAKILKTASENSLEKYATILTNQGMINAKGSTNPAAAAQKYITNNGGVFGALSSSSSNAERLAVLKYGATSLVTNLTSQFNKFLLGTGLVKVGAQLENSSDNLARVASHLLKIIGGGVAGNSIGGMLGGTLSALTGISQLNPIVTGISTILGGVFASVMAIQKGAEEERARREREGGEKSLAYRTEKAEDFISQVVEHTKLGGSDFDAGSETGKYAENQLKNYLLSLNSGDWDLDDAMNVLLNANATAKISKKLAELDDTDAFKNSYINAESSDIIKDINANDETRKMRDDLAEMIRKNHLLGEDADYSSSVANETLVKQLFAGQGGAFTKEQYQMYMREWTSAEESIGTQAKNIYDTVKEMEKNDVKAQTSRKNLEDMLREIRLGEASVYVAAKAAVPVALQPYTATTVSDNKKNDIKANLESAGVNVGSLDNQSQLNNLNVVSAQTRARQGGGFSEEQLSDKLLSENMSWGGIYNRLAEAFADAVSNGASEDLFNKIDEAAKELRGLRDFSLDSYIRFLKKWKDVIFYKAAGGLIRQITPIFRANGGMARGVDTVPAMLQPGEFVMRKASVAKVGMSALNALNRGDLMAAARSLGSRFTNSTNNSRNWSNVVNNNQRRTNNTFYISNRNDSGRINAYNSLANRIALAS